MSTPSIEELQDLIRNSTLDLLFLRHKQMNVMDTLKTVSETLEQMQLKESK